MSDYPDPFQTYNQRPISDLISTPDTSHRERALRKLPQPGEIGEDELYVMIIRPPFEELYELVLHDGQSEELEQIEAYDWFRERGANMDMVEKAMNHAWNFYSAELVVKNPCDPQAKRPAEPEI